MTETDAFFTHAIVGSPQSLILGRRATSSSANYQGLKIHLESGEAGLTQLWREWVVLSRATDPVGQPRVRPGRLRAFMERRALVIASLGVVGLIAGAVLLGIQSWR